MKQIISRTQAINALLSGRTVFNTNNLMGWQLGRPECASKRYAKRFLARCAREARDSVNQAIEWFVFDDYN